MPTRKKAPAKRQPGALAKARAALNETARQYEENLAKWQSEGVLRENLITALKHEVETANDLAARETERWRQRTLVLVRALVRYMQEDRNAAAPGPTAFRQACEAIAPPV